MTNYLRAKTPTVSTSTLNHISQRVALVSPFHRIASSGAAVLFPDPKHQATTCRVALFFSRASTAFQSMFEKKASIYLGRSAGL